MNKKMRIFMSAFLILLLAGCSTRMNESVRSIPNQALVEGLLATNKYFLENSKQLKGDIVISAAGKGAYQGSSLEIMLRSTSEKNSMNVKGNVSSQTALFLVDSLAKTNLNGSGFKLDLASVSQEYQLGNTGNLSTQFLTLNEDVLTPFFKTNALYFETEDNKIAFAQGLSQHIVSSQTDVASNNEINTIYTLELKTDSLSYILPFTVPSYSQKVRVRIVQNQKTKSLQHLDIVIYQDRIANKEQTLIFDIDVSLQFDVRMDGEHNG